MKAKHKQQGFSFLEVVIVLFLLAMMLVLYESALNAIALSRNAQDQESALRIANNKIEQLRASGYSSLTVGNSNFNDPALSTIPSGGGDHTVIDFTTTTKQVTVTVTWREPGSGNDHRVILDTLVTRIGGL